MNVKCPKKTNRWAHLGRLLNFFKSYRRPLLEYTRNKRADMLASDKWWIITYAVAPAIDAINITMTQLQARSLLIAQQETLLQNLIGTIVTMFDIEIVDTNEALEDSAYVQQGSVRIPTETIARHIEDQGSFVRNLYVLLEAADQMAVVNQIATCAMALVAGLQSVKAERDNNNRPSEKDAPPVLPGQLVKLRHGAFLSDVLDPHRRHASSSWSEESMEQLDTAHRALLRLYQADPILRATIDRHDHQTTFNDPWDYAPRRFERLCSFCGGLATVFANTISVFSILKWELDGSRTAVMHLSLGRASGRIKRWKSYCVSSSSPTPTRIGRMPSPICKQR